MSLPAPLAPKISAPETTVAPPRSRSLRLQVRFLQTILFAWWLFGRLIAWYFVMPRLIGRERVERGNLARWAGYAREFRRFAIHMGGVMIKLGQFISTRVDVLPEEILRELTSLQDEVPSIPYTEIRTVIEAELGAIPARFEWIDEKPVAAASLGQVHRARLLNGDRVVIKVQRPGIREVCYTDLAALKVVARAAMRFKFVRRRADTRQLANEFGRVLLQELSYRQEAQNAARFAAMFKDNLGVYIPQVYTEHSTDCVIVLEDVTTIKINDYAAMDSAGISRKAVAARLMDTYLKQIFEERFFHADPHPGNLFVYPLPAADGQTFDKEGRSFYLIFVDFGMTGTLTENISRGLVNTLAAVVKRDARELIQCYQDLGILLPGADVSRLEEATKATFDQVWGLNMAQIQKMDYKDVANIGREFNDLIYAMPFRMPQDFIYLGRAVGILSGMCTSLDPAYNPWHELQPYAQRLIANGFGLNGSTPNAIIPSASGAFSLLQSLMNGNAPQALFQAARTLSNLTARPQRVDAVFAQMERGDLKVQAQLAPEIHQRLARLEGQSRRTTRAVLFGSFLIAATLLYTHGDSTLALLGFGLAGFIGLALVFTGSD